MFEDWAIVAMMSARLLDRTRSLLHTSTMKLGYTIVYVPNVSASLDFFERAFGLKRRFLHESGTYGELDTGATTLSFAAHELGDANFPGGHVRAHSSSQPLGMEVALVTSNVVAAHSKAVASHGEALGPSRLVRPCAGRHTH